MDAFHNLPRLQTRLGHPADAGRPVVMVAGLNALQATEAFVTRLLPFGNQVLIGPAFVQAELVQLPADLFAAVVQIVDIAAPLMRQTEDRPQRFTLSLPFVGLALSISHLRIQRFQCGFYQLPSLWIFSSSSSDLRHLE